MNMEFLKLNKLDTTTMLSVTSGSTTAYKLFDRYTSKYWESQNSSDTAAEIITIIFPATVTIDRIILQNINLKDFTIYYNGTTTNLFTFNSNCITTTSDFVSNSVTNLYLYWNSATAITSISIKTSATMIANEQKKIGELWVTKQWFQFPENPSVKNFKPAIDRKEYVYEMSDGGVALYVINEVYKADIKLDFVSSATMQSLYSIWSAYDNFVFVPNPTGTNWDGKIYEVNWIGEFNFEQFADNYKGNGYTGSIKLRETAK